MSKSADVIFTAVMSILTITSAIGNSLVCTVMIRNPDMRIPINYLLVNLAIADIMYSIFLLPTFILNHSSTHPDGMTGTVLCTLLTGGNLAWVGASSSVVTLVVIAVERYFAVIYPHGNRWKLTMPKLKIIIPSCWLFSFLLNFPKFLNNDVRKIRDRVVCVHLWSDWISKGYFWSWLAFVVISFILIVWLYSIVVYTLWFKQNHGNELACQQRAVMKLRKRVTMMVVAVSAIFGICWPTDLILHVVDNVAGIDRVVFSVTHTMIMFNSAMNPFAYALINHRFREKIKAIVCCHPSRVYVAREPQCRDE